MAEVTAYLQTFDRQDRYDIDGDGNFAEPDGFIDHFRSSIPAGMRPPVTPTRVVTRSGARC